MKLKKRFSVCFSLLLIFNLIFSYGTYAATTDTKLNTSVDLANLVFKGYNKGALGPISIAPVTLVKNGSNISAYLVCLSGTESVKNQSTGFLTDLKSGFEQNSPYLLSVINAINNNIPKNSNLIIAGHSLGGMIAEQTSGNSAVKNNYNVLNVITFGSPLVNPFGREGDIKRLGDKSDVVPYLSAMGTMLLPWQVFGLNKEDGKYNNPIDAHIKSYLRDDVWGSYDALGFKNGTSYIKYDNSAIKYYQAPVK